MLANRRQGIRQCVSGNAHAQERTSRVFRLSGAKSQTPGKLLGGYRQFEPDPSLGAHNSRHPQNSKSLPAKSNSSKRGLTIRGTFTPSAAFALVCATRGARRRSLTMPHSLNGGIGIAAVRLVGRTENASHC